MDISFDVQLIHTTFRDLLLLPSSGNWLSLYWHIFYCFEH